MDNLEYLKEVEKSIQKKYKKKLWRPFCKAINQYELVKPGDKVTTTDIIGKTGSSGGSRVPHLHLEIRKSNTEETGLAYTIDPLELLPDIDLNSLKAEFTLEPYASLWRKLTSEKPWDFSKEDIPYADDKNYIR